IRNRDLLHFRLWYKTDFVLNQSIQFTKSDIKQATQRKLTYSDKNNAYYLECIRAESLEGESEGEGLWFIVLIEFNVLGYWFKNRPIEEHERILKVLSLWGYENEHGQNPTPFSSSHKGILTP